MIDKPTQWTVYPIHDLAQARTILMEIWLEQNSAIACNSVTVEVAYEAFTAIHTIANEALSGERDWAGFAVKYGWGRVKALSKGDVLLE